MISNDTKEYLTSWGYSFIEAYKVLLACLLSIFVPQFCPETGTTCSLNDNFQNLTRFNEFVIAWNFLTLACFIWLYTIQNRRESYLIKKLDVDRNFAVTDFVKNCKDFPFVIKKVEIWNLKLKGITQLTSVVFICNAIFSAILVGYYYYDGFRTATTLVANLLLITSKLFSLYVLMQDCCAFPPLALSSYRQSPVGYNVMDPDELNKNSSNQSDANEVNLPPVELVAKN